MLFSGTVFKIGTVNGTVKNKQTPQTLKILAPPRYLLNNSTRNEASVSMTASSYAHTYTVFS